MTAQILDGKAVASLLKQEIKTTMIQRRLSFGLAVILVGDDPASQIYVMNKRKACLDVGITPYHFELPSQVSENELLELIHKLNANPTVNGILVQLPLPKQIETQKVIEAIAVHKDVDGFHPYNLGRLAQRSPLLRPCTPYGIIQLLKHYQLALEGLHVVIIGASNIVGRPMALECLLAGATTTICHRYTTHLKEHVQMADVLIVAAGKMDLVDPDWLLAHQIIIDVGIHRLPSGAIRGDLDFIKAKEKVAWITPVPGGVGPMTIVTLIQNTVMPVFNS